MCGIFTLINDISIFPKSFVNQQFDKGKHRGPEYSTCISLGNDVTFGFHRLAINGLNDKSNQPFIIDNIALICNGEIYNYKELFKDINITPQTDSDCEVIIHLYKLVGIEQTLALLDGEFSFVLYDMRIRTDNNPTKIFIARDPLGLFRRWFFKINNASIPCFAFASEMKMLTGFCNNDSTVEHFIPGTYTLLEKSFRVSAKWTETITNKPYFLLNHSYTPQTTQNEMEYAIHGIQTHLINAVKKRYLNSERPIACLLSGGLDSSLITALVVNIHKEYSTTPVETYSIGLKNSEDLMHAKIVADYLGTNHTEIIVTEQEMLNAIPDVIYNIESYDTTTVRASIGNYLLGKYISQNSDAKVIFNGDGSDELCGGYLYMNKAPNAIEFDMEIRRLLTDIHKYDVLRSDKCICSHGLESRPPFLDKHFVNFYLTLPYSLRMHQNMNKCEKFLLRHSFSFLNYSPNDKQILPDSILWRKKEAFSDGVSGSTRSLYTIIQEFADATIHTNTDPDTNTDTNTDYIDYIYLHNPPKTKEQLYYRQLFNTFFPNLESVVPYFWMPKFIEATDPSARTLSFYNEPST